MATRSGRFKRGWVLAPEDIPVDEHFLIVRVDHPDLGLLYADSTTLYVDPPGSAAC